MSRSVAPSRDTLSKAWKNRLLGRVMEGRFAGVPAPLNGVAGRACWGVDIGLLPGASR